MAKRDCALPEGLVGLLRSRADGEAARQAYVFLADGETATDSLTWAQLDLRARAVAALLQATGARGERVLLLLPPGLDLVAAFFGCWYAGAVAVPCQPPHRRKEQPRLRAVAADARPRLVLVDRSLAARRHEIIARVPELAAARWIACDEAGDGDAEAWAPTPTSLEEPALLQYTSGSTSTPKGVVVTHANLVHNEEMIHRAFGLSRESVIVGWLPLYHDMGLIGNVLQPLYAGALCVLMPPLAFLQRPARWLEAVARYRGTTSGGPNFAYDLCVRKVGPEERDGLDLSSWRVAFNGAEPVRAETLERFAETFAPCGFERRALYPCYGLAEATLFVAGGTPGAGPRVRSVDGGALARDRVEPPREGAPRRELVSCGGSGWGQEVLVVDPADGSPLPAGRVGEVWVSGPSVARGYFGRPEETERAFAVGSPGRQGRFLRTGDLGFLDGGELFLTGRLKELIILRGRNLYPHDIEQTARRSHAALRAGVGAAFAVDAGGEERLVLVQEVERTWRGGPEAVEEVAAAVRRAVAEEYEARVHELVLARPGVVPRTTSGKIQRNACRRLYEDGALRAVGRSRSREEVSEPEAAGLPLSRQALLGFPAEERFEVLESWLLRQAAAAARLPLSRLEPVRPLTSWGLDSLAAMELQQSVADALGVAVPAADLLAGATAADLARLVLGELQAAVPPLPAVEGEGGDELLSHGERALWFLNRLVPDSSAYNIAAAARLLVAPDPEELRRALAALVARHGALRTTFGVRDGEPYRRVAPAGEVDFRVVEAAHLDGRELADRIGEEAHRPFDLHRGPLLRVRLLEGAAGGSVLVLAVHHAIADFWSLALLARELGELLGGAELPAPAWDGAAAARWERRRLAAEGERLWEYWRRRLEGATLALDLPVDRPRPPVASLRGAAVAGRIDGATLGAVHTVARRCGTTPFAVYLAAFQALLHRHTGADGFLVGVPTTGRARPEQAEAVGYLVNPLPLRADLSGQPSFSDLVDRVRDELLGALAHRDLPFPLLAERLQPERDPGRSPLFQTMLLLQRAPAGASQALAASAVGEPGVRLDLGPLALESVAIEERASQFDLTLRLAELGGALHASLQYATDLFAPTTARRLLRRFHLLLAAAVAQPRRPVADLPLLAPEQRQQLLCAWSGADRSVDAGGLRLHDLFFRQAEGTPEATALVHGDERLSYAEVAARARGLTRRLQALGTGAEERVAVLVERGPDLVVSLLAVLAAGAAYVPLDAAYPDERLARMVAGAGARTAVCGDRFRPRLAGLAGALERIVSPREPAPPEARLASPRSDDAGPRNLAYVIFTSGSTGEPKGVAVEHRSAVARMLWARRAFSPRELEAVLGATSVCFDVSVFEIFAPLSWGGALVMVESALDLASVPAAVTLACAVPSVVAEVVGGALPASLRAVNLAGETLPGSLASRLRAAAPAARIRNIYGPTEDTCYSTWALLGNGAPDEPPIGRPLPGTRGYVLDAGLRPVPPGVAGELFLGGAGLSRGYLGQPALTARRFVPDPFADHGSGTGQRLYRTGDRVRHRPDGSLEHLGRLDRQMKIRGFRVEAAEVEAALLAHPGVGEAVAAAIPGGEGEAVLAAWVVPAPGVDPAALVAALRHRLEDRLPSTMVPTAWRVLEALPRLPNGKLDRRALPAPEAAEGAGVWEVPRTPVEEVVAGIWARVLGVERVGAGDHFFELGGHSLSAARVVVRMREAFGVELPVSALFQAPVLSRLARRVEAARRGEGEGRGEGQQVPPLLPVPRHDGLPLSFAQEQLWVLDQLVPENPFYNMVGALRLGGPLDAAALARSLREVARRHESLRTTFPAVEGVPRQVVAAEPGLPLPAVDLSGLEPRTAEAELERCLRQAARRPFDLQRGPLIRALLLRLGEGEHALGVSLHHIVGDGWSIAILQRELAALYDAFRAGRPSPLPALPVQYADFAAWQRGWLRGEILERLLEGWRRLLDGAPLSLDLPTDRPRRPLHHARGGSIPFTWPAPLAAGCRQLARRHGATSAMLTLAAFQALLGRLAGQDDLLVGSPAANRSRRQIEGLVGFFVNTLVLRADLSGDPAFATLLGRVREVCLRAYELQDLPFERLVEALQPERSPGRNPLVQVVFGYQSFPRDAPRMAGLEVAPLAGSTVDTGSAKFDLSVFLWEEGEGLGGLVEYDRDLFDRATAARLLGWLERLQAAAVAEPGTPLTALPLLAAAERHQLLREWGGTGRRPSAEATLPDLFAARAGKAPDAVAVVCDGAALTYGELDRRADRLAHRLQELGLGPGSLLPLCVEPSLGLVTAVLAALKAGAAYVPLDPSHPAERLAQTLEDCGEARVLTQAALVSRLPAAARPLLVEGGDDGSDGSQRSAAAPRRRPAPADLAYVLYTSGSTGRPKGVLIPHDRVVRLFAATEGWFGFGPGDVWSLFHSYAFDFSVWEIWGALLYGGRLVVVPRPVTRSPEAFLELLAAERVTVLNQTPSAFRQLAWADGARRPRLALRRVIFGGEALDPAALGPWFGRHGDREPRLVNMYGITETTVHVTYRPLRAADAQGGPASLIGRPIPDLSVYLLDRRMVPSPLGVGGEIFVGGAGLARGYLGRPGLTAERFVPDPYAPEPGARLYASGDLARRRPDGEVEYLGRLDGQVKLRGFRIELVEIESALAACPGVRAAAVVLRQDRPGEKRLVAYVVAGEPAPSRGTLRRHLAERLPEPMVPAAFVFLDALPLTANGKLDRRALPAPGGERPELDEAYAPPATPEEERLAAAWAEALGLDRVGALDNFFALGGDSILAIRARWLAEERGLRFPVQELLRRQTVRELAAVAERAEGGGGEAPSGPYSLLAAEDRERLPAGVEDAYPLARLQAGLLFHSEAKSAGSSAYTDTFALHLRARFDPDALAGAVADLTARHEVLRTSFDFGRYSEPLQLVHRVVPTPLEVVDLGALPPAEGEARVEAWLAARRAEGFDPARPPLIRWAAHRLSYETFHLSLAVHHAILDGWSLATVLRELFVLYFARLGEGPPLEAPPPGRYRDLVALERSATDPAGALRFWRRQLAGGGPTRLPRRRGERAPAAGERLASRSVLVPREVTAGLQRAAREAGVHLKHVLLAAHARCLAAAAGSREVQTAIALHGRPEGPGGERLVGLFLNTLPLRLPVAGGSWLDLARRAWEVEGRMLPHRRYPLADLQRELGGTPLFETCFNFVHFHLHRDLEELPGLKVLGSRAHAESSFVLLCEAELSPDGSELRLSLDYDAFELEGAQVERLAGSFGAALAAVARDPMAPHELFSPLSTAQRHQVVFEANDTRVPRPRTVGVHALVAAQAARAPEAVAVEMGGRRLTYGELDRAANRLARRLRGRGVGPEVLVGLCVERSPAAVVALLAVLKAGGAYLPLDPSYPRERLALMLEEARAPVVLSEERLLGVLPPHGGDVLCLDGAVGWEEKGDGLVDAGAGGLHLAYVAYTSGSTGRPKGVAVTHQGVVRLVQAGGYARLDAGESVLAFAPLAFDASTFEIWGCLANGGRLVLAPPGTPSLEELSALIRDSRVTTLWLTSGLFHEMVERRLGDLGGLRQLLAGGDVLAVPRVRAAAEALPGCRLISCYGPTEVTTFTTTFPVTEPAAMGGSVPIGRPIADTSVYVLDAGARPAPQGTPGELYAGGDGLARGYLHRPAATAERFVPHPFPQLPGERLYRTGDLVVLQPEGVMEFLHRVDDQVKIRGFRVEPGEVEAALARHPEVGAAAVVVDRRRGGASLRAFFVPAAGASPTPGDVQRFLADRLPAFMMPAVCVAVERLPLGPTGKVDRRALEDLAVVAEDGATGPGGLPGGPPSGPIQELLAEIWAGVLGLERVGARDDFFELGGHSLAAMRLISLTREAFGVELPLQALFEAPTVAGLARHVEAALRAEPTEPLPPLTATERHGPAPASFAQQRLWLIDQRRPGSAAYNVPGVLALEGPLSVPALAAALDGIVARHAALRTTFEAVDGAPYQRVHPAAGLALMRVDLSGVDGEGEGEELIRRGARRPFDLRRGPLVRAVLLCDGAQRHRLLLTLHHTVADGWSVDVFLRELEALYRAALAGAPAALPELPVQYADFAVWQRGWLEGETLETQLGYWRRALDGLPALELPADRPRPPAPSGRGAVVSAPLPPALSQSLAALGRSRGATPFMVFLAAFQALLARHADSRDLAVGAPVAGRRWPEVEGLIGFFVNTLPLRLRLSGAPSFAELIGRSRDSVLAAFAHQDIPFELLVEHLEPDRAADRPPLVQVLFALQPPPEVPALPDLEAQVRAVATGAVKVDLTLALAEERDGGHTAALEADLDLFDHTTARRLLARFERLLEAVVAAPEAPVEALPLLGPAERFQLLAEWNDTGAAGGPESVLDLIAEHVARRGDAVALTAGGRHLTWGRLDALARHLAGRLAKRGVGPESVVALRLPGGPERVVAMLAALAAGGAFLPLDPQWPEDRQRLLAADSGAAVLLGAEDVRLDDPADDPADDAAGAPGQDAGRGDVRRPCCGGQLAYVIYTSGSTGRPKGVALTHAGLLNLVLWHRRAFGVTPSDRVAQVAGLGFDAAVWEIWGALAAGASLHLAPPQDRLVPERLQRWLVAAGVTLAFVPTPLAERLLALDWPRPTALRRLLTGGDRLRRPEARDRPFALINNYGPTEATVVTTSGRVPEAGEALPPIGRPVANSRGYLLDRGMRPLPPGAPGELFLAGAGLARGYLGQSAATAAAFVPDPFSGDGGRFYGSGDRARWRPDGSLEFLGRRDQQVKVRGVRVEPAEAEAALLLQPGIREAAVLAREVGAGGLALVGYVVGEGWTPEGLRRALRETLPEALVPAAFVGLDALPLTPNGKVDRRALAELAAEADGGGGSGGRSGAGGAPETPSEEALAAIWTDLLDGVLPGRDDDFFDLGGHSLLAASMIGRVGEAFGVELPVQAVFDAPRLRELAAAIDEARREQGGVPPVEPTSGDRMPASFAQQRLWFLHHLRADSAAYSMPMVFGVSGRPRPAVLAAALGEIVRRHEPLRTTFEVSAEGSLLQRISPWPAGRPAAVPEIDLRALPAARIEAEATRLTRAEIRRRFDLARGPLARFRLLRTAESEAVLLANFHHTVMDGWSFSVFARELGALYRAGVEGRPSPLPELRVRYADFAAWQRRRMEAGELDEQLAWWRRRLAGEAGEAGTGALEVAGTPAAAGEEARAERSLGRPLTGELQQLARGSGATLFMVLLAAFQLLLARLAGSDDVVVGTPVAGRPRPELEGLAGLFLNALALRTDLSGDPTFVELLVRAREVCLGAYAHQELPFERLVEELQPKRDAERHPLFEVMLNLINIPREPLRLPGVTFSWKAPMEPAAKLPLALFGLEEEDGLILELLADPSRFSRADAERLLEQVEGVLRQAVENPEARLSTFSLLTPACRAALPDPVAALPAAAYAPVVGGLAAWAQRTPEAVALAQGPHRLSYGALAAAVARLARTLGERGLAPGEVVAVWGERSPGLIAAAAAVLAAGGVLLLLDLDLPEPRHRRMVELSAARRLLVVGEPHGGLQGLGLEPVVGPVDPATGHFPGAPAAAGPVPVPDADLAAYIFFTSGSSGTPKGVLGRHQGLAHFVAWQGRRFDLGPGDRCAQLAAPAVDVILRESFLALTTGATLCLPDRQGAAGPGGLLEWCERQRVTLAHSVPSLARAWLAAATPAVSLASLRWLFLVGEPLGAGLVQAWRRRFPGGGVVNLYGSTESNLAKSAFVVPDPAPPGNQPAGGPLPETQLLVLGPGGRPCAVGEGGEIALRTAFLSLGYVGLPAETARRFVPNPCPGAPAGERILLTGDGGRFLPDGGVEVLGRRDGQVKIRGVRIEPEEVAAVLCDHGAVADCAVLARRDGTEGHRLEAYVVPRGEAPSAADLLAHCARHLPAAMVPSAVAFLDGLPRTATGKLDLRALGERGAPAPEEGEPTAPRTPVEELVAGIWAGVLGRERVGVHDNFFALGGHSLLATQVASRLRQVFGVDLPLRRLFEAPTVAALAADVAAAGHERWRGGPVARRRQGEERPLSSAQERIWLLDQIAPPAAYNLPVALRLRGRLDVRALAVAFSQVLRRHEVLRAVFPGRDGRPSQRVVPATRFQPPLVDLSGLAEAGRERQLRRLARRGGRRPFDLARGPLYRLAVARLGAGDHALLLTLHHIVSDGWSRSVLTAELSTLYRAASEGGRAALPELPLQYADYAEWERQRLEGDALEGSLEHWRSTLAGAPSAVDLPTEGPRREDGPTRGGHYLSRLSAEETAAVAALARNGDATLFMVLLAAFDLLLWKWSGQDDLVVGTVVGDRPHPGTEGLIGCFINFLPLRPRLPADGSGTDLLREVRAAVLGAWAHQDCPFERLVEAVSRERRAGANPLYNVAFLLQSFPVGEVATDLRAEVLPVDNGAALLDLRLVAMEDPGGGGLDLWWEYDRSLFAPETVERLAAAYAATLARLAGEPEAPLAAFELPAELPRRQPEPRLVVAATFTADPVLKPLRFWLDRLDMEMEVELAPYHQVFQQLLDESSATSSNRLGANALLIRLEDWTPFRDAGATRPGEALRAAAERAVGDLVAALESAASRGGAPWLVLLCPPSPAFAAAVGGDAVLAPLEERIAAAAEGLSGVYAATGRELAELYPVADPFDPHADELGHVPYTATFFTALATLLVRKLHALGRPPYKVVAVDCDGTLWGGVCGEDGPMGVRLDGPYRAVQELLVRQHDAGMLICLCSKNVEADVAAVFEQRPEMPLRSEHITAWQVHWGPKSGSLRTLAQELGLGLDSFIFLDDNPVECAEVRAGCPQVLTLQLPADPAEIPRFLRHVWAFDHLKVTAEDRKRTEMVRSNRRREELRQSSTSLEEFLAGLQLRVDIQPVAAERMPRVAQLVQRTNQFNLTLVRRSEAEITHFLGAEGEGLQVEVRDRFGEYGLVGVALFTCDTEALVVDTLLLSCRVLGRGVEGRLLARLAEIAGERGLARVDLPWVPGERNQPALDFLEAAAGAYREPRGDGLVFRLPVAAAAPVKEA